jgi:hypothetical protein
MPSETLYRAALQNMARTLDLLSGRVPAPQKVQYKDSFVFRHVERSIHQAIVQKLARIISTLAAAQLLMTHGFVQEQAALQRILGELHEDVTFLALGDIKGDVTQLHEEFLDAFFEEEFDADTALASTQKRPMSPRKKIQAYIARNEGASLDPSTGVELSRTITKAYSGFVHAASPQIMDMYGGNPPRFHVDGLLGTERHREHREDLWNYFYRSILAFGFAAKAFGDQPLFDQISEFLVEFERSNNKTYTPSRT